MTHAYGVRTAQALESTRHERAVSRASSPGRIWIDLDNTPHVPFFVPIIKELESRGYSLLVTVRDAYQACEMADLFHLKYERVGRHYGKHMTAKVLGTCYRAMRLLSVAAREKPDLAVSHGSRAQILASGMMGIPSLNLIDYEFAGRSVLFKPTWVMAPDVIPAEAIQHLSGRALSYHGIKEDVYVPTFTPDPSITSRLGLNTNSVVVLVRPPATEAHYHNALSDEMFRATIEFLGEAPGVQAVLVPRNAKQAASIRASWPGLLSTEKIKILEHAEDGLNLIWHADLVISGGGTMNREAAALGVPVYSTFRSQIGAVDRYLAKSGRLTLLESADDVRTKIVLTHRRRAPHASHQEPSVAGREIVDAIVALAESKGERGVACPVI